MNAREKIAPSSEALQPYMKDWMRWFDENVEREGYIEWVVTCPEYGYAGRVDMVAKLKNIGWAVVDFKTQKVKRNAKGEAKPVFYETWPLQLAAYHYPISSVLAKPIDGLVTVVINSAEPGPVHVKTWSGVPEGTAKEEYFFPFVHALELWKYMKGYDPTAPLGWCEKPELN